MKKLILVSIFILMTTVLYGQTLFIASEDIAVTGAVTAELMLELRSGDGRALVGNRFICHFIDGEYVIAIDLHNYNITTSILYDILRTLHTWMNDFRMTYHPGFIDEIRLVYPLNGRNNLVYVYIAYPDY